MNYNELIQLYFERSNAMQQYWNLYVIIVGGVLAFSSLRKQPAAVTTALVCILFALFAYENLDAMKDTTAQRFATIEAIKQFDSGGVTASPSKQVRDPVYFGGPMLRQAVFAVVHIDHTPGPGSIQMMKELFLATQVTVVDHIIDETPNDARYYVGYVAWRPGELRQEIDRGLWYVLDADPDLVFRKDPARLWEELLRRARAVTAWAPG